MNEDRDAQFLQVMAQLKSIPGITPLEAQLAARILVFNDPVRGRTEAEQAVILTIFNKLTRVDKEVSRANQILSEDVERFIKFIQAKYNHLTRIQAVLVTAAIINGFPELFRENPSMANCLDDAVMWVAKLNEK